MASGTQHGQPGEIPLPGKAIDNIAEEEQDGMGNSLLEPTIVGPASFGSPDPATSALSVNMPLDEAIESDSTPEIDEDYGVVELPHLAREGVVSGLDDPDAGWQEFKNAAENSKTLGELASVEEAYLETDKEWKSVDDAIEERREALQKDADANAGDWLDEVAKAEDAESLGNIRTRYTNSGSEFSTVVDALDERAEEFQSDTPDEN